MYCHTSRTSYFSIIYSVFKTIKFFPIRSPPRYDWESRLASLQVNIINTINSLIILIIDCLHIQDHKDNHLQPQETNFLSVNTRIVSPRVPPKEVTSDCHCHQNNHHLCHQYDHHHQYNHHPCHNHHPYHNNHHHYSQLSPQSQLTTTTISWKSCKPSQFHLSPVEHCGQLGPGWGAQPLWHEGVNFSSQPLWHERGIRGGPWALCCLWGQSFRYLYVVSSIGRNLFLSWYAQKMNSLPFAVFVLKMHESCFRLVDHRPNWCNLPLTGWWCQSQPEITQKSTALWHLKGWQVTFPSGCRAALWRHQLRGLQGILQEEHQEADRLVLNPRCAA